MTNSVSVIIPAFNEELGIAAVLERVLSVFDSVECDYELIVVDDGSSDNTCKIAQEYPVHVLQHYKNRGYGAALKTGIRAAKYEYIIINDADGTYPVDRIPDMLKGMEKADMVVGARLGKKVSIPLVRRPAKWFLRKLAEYITGEKIPDLNSGLRIFRKSIALEYLSILSDKFSFTTTITVAMLSDNYRVIYLPIDYHQREGKSKITPWNFFDFINLILRLSMLFNPLKVFVPISLTILLFALIKIVFDLVLAFQQAGGLNFVFLTSQMISTGALILFLSGLQILLIGMMADGITRKLNRQNETVQK